MKPTELEDVLVSSSQLGENRPLVLVDQLCGSLLLNGRQEGLKRKIMILRYFLGVLSCGSYSPNDLHTWQLCSCAINQSWAAFHQHMHVHECREANNGQKTCASTQQAVGRIVDTTWAVGQTRRIP